MNTSDLDEINYAINKTLHIGLIESGRLKPEIKTLLQDFVKNFFSKVSYLEKSS